MRRASSAVASSPRPASSAAINASRRTKRSTALPTVSAGRRASIRAMPSPVTATTGVLEAYTPRLRTRPATVAPRARASECSSLKSGSIVSSQSDRRTEAHLHADPLADRAGEASIEGPHHDDAHSGQARHLGGWRRAPRPAGTAARRGIARLARGPARRARPSESARRRGQHGIVRDHRADVEAARLAEPPHEELERFGLAGAKQPLQRRPAREQPRGGQRILAAAPDLVARLDTREADLRERLLLGLLAQQARAGQGQCDDGDEQQPPMVSASVRPSVRVPTTLVAAGSRACLRRWPWRQLAVRPSATPPAT